MLNAGAENNSMICLNGNDRSQMSGFSPFCRATAIAFLFLTPFFASANSYWLIGSFPDRSLALSEAERISSSLVREVYLRDDGERYQVLIDVTENFSDQEVLRRRLRAAGIEKFSPVDYSDNSTQLEMIFNLLDGDGDFAELDGVADDLIEELDRQDIAEIDAMLAGYDFDVPLSTGDEELSIGTEDEVLFDGLSVSSDSLLKADAVSSSGVYVCVASFLSEVKANSMAGHLEVSGYDVLVHAVSVNGSEFFRVLVGAVRPSDEEGLMADLKDMGYLDAWLVKAQVAVALPRTPELGGELTFEDEPVVIKKTHLTPPAISNEAYPGDDSDYNLARLRRD